MKARFDDCQTKTLSTKQWQRKYDATQRMSKHSGAINCQHTLTYTRAHTGAAKYKQRTVGRQRDAER